MSDLRAKKEHKMTSNPGPQEVVELLCALISEEERDRRVKDKNGTECIVQKKHRTYSYLNKNCKKGGNIILEAGTGYTNAFYYLKSCVCQGNSTQLHELHEENL